VTEPVVIFGNNIKWLQRWSEQWTSTLRTPADRIPAKVIFWMSFIASSKTGRH